MPVTSAIAADLALSLASGLTQKGVEHGFAKAKEKRQFLTFSLWRRNGKARVSASALLRIFRSDGSFAIIQNRHRPEDYSAIGGVYKCYPAVGPQEMDRFEFIEENQLRDRDIKLDVRGYTKRKFVSSLFKWFKDERSSKETYRQCLTREMKEELTEEHSIIDSAFAFHNLNFRFSHDHYKVTNWDQSHNRITQIQLFKVYDLIPDDLSRDLFDRLMSDTSGAILWVERTDIRHGRCRRKNKPIGAPVDLFIGPTVRRTPFSPPQLTDVDFD